MDEYKQESEIRVRKPDIEDGEEVWRLVQTSKPLETNSLYAYLLLCAHFNETCAVAENGAEIVGFVSGYEPPSEPGVLFVWQIAVKESMRQRGLAKRMIMEILRSPACLNLHSLQATVTPSNPGSKALFTSLAKDLNAPLQEEVMFGGELFGEAEHEDEIVLRIGPFNLPEAAGRR